MGNRRILVADDEIEIAELVCIALAEAGFDTAAAGSGKQCLELFNSYRPELVILDINLPDIDGWEVLSRLAQFKRPVAVLIASASEHAGRKLVGFNLLPLQDYILKPHGAAELLAKVETLLLSAKSAQERTL